MSATIPQPTPAATEIVLSGAARSGPWPWTTSRRTALSRSVLGVPVATGCHPGRVLSTRPTWTGWTKTWTLRRSSEWCCERRAAGPPYCGRGRPG